VTAPRLVPLGDAALLAVLGDHYDARVNARVHRLAAAIRELGDPALGAPVPGAASVLVPFDPLVIGPAAAADRIAVAIAAVATRRARPRPAPVVELPTRYGGEDGPDLAVVAAAAGLSPAAVVDLHASIEYVVAFLGFAPGFAYLESVPAAIASPRRATPRERVPAGSVGIADRQTGVFPGGSPGGWQLIGRTDVAVWDARRDPPALLVPGTRVRFVPVS
jgi:KipI family sensor histidine kinase inhibitor